MLAALVFGAALAATADSTVLDAAAACRLTTSSPPLGKPLTVRGIFISDGMHGAILELPGCEVGLFPQPEEDFLTRLNRFHEDFYAKCGGILLGDHVEGAFTGYFVRRRVQLFGMPKPAPVDIFVVTGVETEKRDPAEIACPK